ncbi:MAG: DUF2058 domain-containing protein [Pseudomonadota bacterium]|jgi:uncharacterized protein YaiL (DUF2058 family)|nr:MAG: DUF2058 domain-containing protein [Pseudomonadota bacterium]
MSLSLREQLLKAGLVTEKQVQQVEREQRQQRFQAPRGRKQKPPGPSPAQLAAQKAAAGKAARDAEANRRKQEKLERRAKYAEIKQLVAAHQIPRVETEDYYNFQDGTQIRRIEVTPELRRRLIAGEIAIVRCEGRFAFVPAAIGEQIGERVPKALLHLNRPQDAPAEDDPYKDYAVPDDLMW